MSPVLQEDSLPSEPSGKPCLIVKPPWNSYTTIEGEEEACGRGNMSLDDSLHGGAKMPS